MLFDDGNNFVVDELARGLADKFFFVVELGIKVDEIDTRECGHARSLRSHCSNPPECAATAREKGMRQAGQRSREECVREWNWRVHHIGTGSQFGSRLEYSNKWPEPQVAEYKQFSDN